MALASVATKPKNTTTRKSTPKKIIVHELLTPTNPYELLSERIIGLDTKIDSTKTSLDAKIDSIKTSLDAKIDSIKTSLDAKIDSTKTSLDTKIDSTKNELSEQIRSVNTRIDSFEKSTNSKFNLILVFMGIGFSSIFGLLSVMLSKML